MLLRTLFLHDYFRFGMNFRLLMQGKDGKPINDVILSIKNFTKSLDEFNLKVTKRTVHRANLDGFVKKIKKLDKNSIINNADSEELKSIMNKIYPALDAEITLSHAYMVTDKKLGLDNLLDKVDILFGGDSIFNRLPQTVKLDFKEAGKCIAFERSTAAAFHILRGTEGMLRAFYFVRVKSKKKRITNPLWDPIITDLKNKNKAPKPLLDVLDNIRMNFRNPTMHPEKTYDVDEVQNLFNLCIDAITRMSKFI